MGPSTEIGQWIHQWKHRLKGESFTEYTNRVASALTVDNPGPPSFGNKFFKTFRSILSEQRFLPGGRIQASVGSGRGTTAFNCFVMDTIEDNSESILRVHSEAFQTMRIGGGVGYDFSNIRPWGDRIKSLDSIASGPVSFMGMFDAACKTIASAGHRRGAQMGVLRIDHPDIQRFIMAKQNHTELTAFNISIAVTDDFMKAVRGNRMYTLSFDGHDYGELHAPTVWEQVMRSTWDWAEPGVLFIDTINRTNNLWYCETIAATNPCGEQPLPPNGACLLGSFNLTKYVVPREWRVDDHTEELGSPLHFDWVTFRNDIPHVVRAMDNVIDYTKYPLAAQELEAKSKRRMGLGVTGLANAGEALGFPYGTPEFLQFEASVLSTLDQQAYVASCALAHEKGSFPLFDADKYLMKGTHASTLPMYIQDLIRANGIRNSHLTSLAPCGTISLGADNVSSSIEPVFSYRYDRTIQTETDTKVVMVEDYGVHTFGVKGKRAEDCTAGDHLNVLLTATKHVDSAVSKTCNVSPDMPWEDFKAIYMEAWVGGAKGCTTFNSGGKRFGVLNAPEDDERAEPLACYVDQKTGERSCE